MSELNAVGTSPASQVKYASARAARASGGIGGLQPVKRPIAKVASMAILEVEPIALLIAITLYPSW
jgi:hypothetical protein